MVDGEVGNDASFWTEARVQVLGYLFYIRAAHSYARRYCLTHLISDLVCQGGELSAA